MLAKRPPAKIICLFQHFVRAFQEGNLILQPGIRLIVRYSLPVALFIHCLKAIHIFFQFPLQVLHSSFSSLECELRTIQYSRTNLFLGPATTVVPKHPV